jgi:hypothetical protein
MEAPLARQANSAHSLPMNADLLCQNSPCMRDEKQLRAEITSLHEELESEINKGLQPSDYWTAKSALLNAKTAALADIHSKRLLRHLDWALLIVIILFVVAVCG